MNESPNIIPPERAGEAFKRMREIVNSGMPIPDNPDELEDLVLQHPRGVTPLKSEEPRKPISRADALDRWQRKQDK